MGATFAAVGDTVIAGSIEADADRERSRLERLALIDLSPLPRSGFKGRGALDWVRAQGVAVGDSDNLAYPNEAGTLAARLAATEVLLLGGLAGEDDLCRRLDSAWSLDSAEAAYLVPRRSANFWFLVTGAHAADMFAKICGVDLRPRHFANHQIAQTSVARINGIIIRDDLDEIPAYHLLGDWASADYLWPCLLDAMAEFGGGPAGWLIVKSNKRK